jgi:hypothetical protein
MAGTGVCCVGELKNQGEGGWWVSLCDEEYEGSCVIGT